MLPGGTGQVGTILARAFVAAGHDVAVLSRTPHDAPWRVVPWDATSVGEWIDEIDGADAVINLAGRSVNCRYTPANRRQILESRFNSTRAVGKAIARAARPPPVWLQASTATNLQQELTEAHCEHVGTLTVGGVTWRLPNASLLDVLESNERWAREALAQPATGPTGLPTIALPYLVLMKLQASRVQDLADITRMLGAADESALQQVRTVINTYMLDAGENVESMIVLGRLEYE